MNLFAFLRPRDIFRTSTRFNRDIRVQMFLGHPVLTVDGSQQSGPYVETLWRRTFSVFGIADLRPQRILVLGVGGGTVIRMMHGLFPRAKITAVDIDDSMIAIGKKYFGLGSLRRLTLIRADAQEYVRRRGTYDLIIIDLFSGASIPVFEESLPFLRQVKKRMSSGGRVLINYLREKGYGAKSDVFAHTLRRVFFVRDYPIFRNRFFLLE